ncbi:GNAT family N-acetyltransferase [Magnetococcus sp. PR-3]|uniref:GNAT family N-acetyltransferase n=1 Tax=Magnetococcus sp. PR-3 TaxID=3120355 RepID=UPI002FCE21A6
MKPIVRHARRGDLDALVTLLEQLFAMEVDFQFDAPTQRQGLLLLLQTPNACLLVIEDQYQVVGMCSLQSIVSSSEGGAVGIVEDVVIAQSHRDQGLGHLLLQALEQEAKAQGLSQLRLVVDQNNGATLAFFQRMGWMGTELVAMMKQL